MHDNEYLELLRSHGYELSEENLITLMSFLEAIITAAHNVANSEAPVREAVKSFTMEFIDSSTMNLPDLTKCIPTFVMHKGRRVPSDKVRKDE